MNDNATRFKPSGAFCWQPKDALRRIRDGFDGEECLAHALALYLAMTEAASDEHSFTFTRRQRQLSERSGVSLRKTAALLKHLRDLGLVDWTQNHVADSGGLGPSTYTLKTPCAWDAQPHALDAQPHAQNSAEFRAELYREESLGESPIRRRFTPPSLTEVQLHFAKIGLPLAEADKYFHFYTSKGWKVGKSAMKSWHSAAAGWKVRWETERKPSASTYTNNRTEKQMISESII